MRQRINRRFSVASTSLHEPVLSSSPQWSCSTVVDYGYCSTADGYSRVISGWPTKPVQTEAPVAVTSFVSSKPTGIAAVSVVQPVAVKEEKGRDITPTIRWLK